MRRPPSFLPYRQQLEELRQKQEQKESAPTKKRRDTKENLQGESAGEKSPEKSKAKTTLTRMSFSHSKTWSLKVLCVPGMG